MFKNYFHGLFKEVFNTLIIILLCVITLYLIVIAQNFFFQIGQEAAKFLTN